MYEVYLCHHGIQGQKWGVRNGPPYPIDHTVMKKGTKLSTIVAYRLPGEEQSSLADPVNKAKLLAERGLKNVPTYTYNPNDEWDSKVYKGPFAYYKVVSTGARFIANYNLEVTKDLKMPTYKERVDEFKNLYNDPKFKKRVAKELNEYRKKLLKNNIASSDEMRNNFKKLNCKKLQSDDDYKAAYEIFNHAMEHKDRNVSTKEYFDRMAKKYDAMVDDNNQGVYNNAHDPVVVFRTHECLKSLNSKYLTVDEVYKNLDYVEQTLAKKGQKVRL